MGQNWLYLQLVDPGRGSVLHRFGRNSPCPFRLSGMMDQCFQAPGRLNLIGEHTDYNGGFVLPIAIQMRATVTASPEAAPLILIHSEAFGESVVIQLDSSSRRKSHWSDYIRAVVAEMKRRGMPLKGVRMHLKSEVPVGAGLSSSAAIEVVSALALLSGSKSPVDPTQVAEMCHRAENDFVGVRSGIMDQSASCLGRAGHALLLDCRSLEVKHIPIPSQVALLACNTMVKHSLASNEYNT